MSFDSWGIFVDSSSRPSRLFFPIHIQARLPDKQRSPSRAQRSLMGYVFLLPLLHKKRYSSLFQAYKLWRASTIPLPLFKHSPPSAVGKCFRSLPLPFQLIISRLLRNMEAVEAKNNYNIGRHTHARAKVACRKFYVGRKKS